MLLTAGRSPFQESNPESLAQTFEIEAELPLTSEMVEAAIEQFLTLNEISGEISNSRVQFDGVTADGDNTPRPKGRAKVVSESFSGDVWVRSARKAKSNRVSRSTLEAQNALYAEALASAGIELPTLVTA